MTISVGAANIGGSATGGASLDIGALTPDPGADKRVIAVAFRHGTTAGSSDSVSATFGGTAMTKVAEVSDPGDPRRVLAVFEHKIGSSTEAGGIVFTSPVSDRWCGVAFALIGVPDSAVPIFNASTTLSALALSFAGAGLLIDVAAVNTDDTSNTNNVITIDAEQTLIRSQNRGVGTNTEARLTVSCKTVMAGSRSGASSSPYSDGVGHIVVGYVEGEGAAALAPAGAMHGQTATAPPLRVRIAPGSTHHGGAASAAMLAPRLAPAGGRHAQAATASGLTIAGSLAVASARHDHKTADVTLEARAPCLPASAHHPHRAGSPTLWGPPPGARGPVLRVHAEARLAHINADARVLRINAA